MDRIRSGLRVLYDSPFEYKGGYLPPVDWRPREFNSPPDVVCNWVLDGKADLDDLDLGPVVQAISQERCFQVHCDGGYKDGVGAASFVVHAIDPASGVVERLGYRGAFLSRARSAFQAELIALETAVQFMNGLHHAFQQIYVKRVGLF